MIKRDSSNPNEYIFNFRYRAVPLDDEWMGEYTLDKGESWFSVTDKTFPTEEEAEEHARKAGSEHVENHLRNIVSSLTQDILHGDNE